MPFLTIGNGIFLQIASVYFSSIMPKVAVSKMVLPGHLIIYLNAESLLRHSMEGFKGNREVFLEREAWFDVAKDKKKPSAVHTLFYIVQVLVTQYNVKAYKNENEIVTTLEKEDVRVTSSKTLK